MPDKKVLVEQSSARRARFERVFTTHYASVLAYGLRPCEPQVAQDVAEVFLVAWRRLDEVPELELPWLYGVARRVLANELRSARRRRALADRSSIALRAGLERSASDPDVIAALAQLRARDRELLLLTAWDGLSSAEAAAALGCSNAAARVRLHRARRRLADELERGGESLRHRNRTLEEQA